MKNNIIKLGIAAFGAFTLGACTDLTEHIYSDNTTDNFYNNESEVISAVLRPYTHSCAVFACQSRQNYWQLNELSADQLAWPVKGPHGYDDAKWIQFHYHTWTNMHASIEDAWNLFFMGLGFCNDAIQNLEDRTAESMNITEEQRAAYIAELRANRAYYYLGIMDLWGNAPIVTKVSDPEMPATNSRQEILDFVYSEMLEIMDDLPLLSQEEQNCGRFTRAAGYAMMATLYLNAEEWTGTARWADCIEYCDRLINGEGGGQNGAMQLDDDIYKPFSNTNSTDSRENILVLAYDYMASGIKCGWAGDMYHFNQRYIYGGTDNGNDGIVVIPSAYDMFEDNDLRKQDWMLIGPQYDYDTGEPVVGTSEYTGQPLVFVRDIKRYSEGDTITSTMYTGEENSGARFNKYNPGPLSDANYYGNDWVLYRLTEFYFDKAEALMRQNGGVATQEAVDLINACRQRAFSAEDWPNEMYTTATLTLDELLAERGREFIFEGKRRTDLIRFGKFLTESWWDHEPTTSEHLKLYPIPYDQVTLNPNLVQNEGY